MATWITVTDNDVRLLDSERAVMESIAPGQTLADCVLSAANFARGYVPPPRATAPAVPPECVDDVIAIARASYLGQDPTGTLLTESRKTERDNAVSHLRDIAKGIVAVTAPDVVESVGPSGGMIETAQEGDTGNSRDDLKRL